MRRNPKNIQPLIKSLSNLNLYPEKYLSFNEISELRHKTLLEIVCEDNNYYFISLYKQDSPYLLSLHFPFSNHKNDIIIDENTITKYYIARRGTYSQNQSKIDSQCKIFKYNFVCFVE